jgi:hypothetical protein
VLGSSAAVERSEHIVSGGRRCVYRMTPSGFYRRRGMFSMSGGSGRDCRYA